MATYNKFQQFVEDVNHAVHDNSSDQFAAFLCAAANAPVAGDAVLADLTEVDYTNLSSRNLTVGSSGQTGGTYSLAINDLVLSASGGSVGPFRYIGIFNDTPSSPADPLVAWFDYGSEITLNDGESITLDFDTTFYSMT